MPRSDMPLSYADDFLPLHDLVVIWERDRPLNEGTRTYSNYEGSFARLVGYLSRTGDGVPRVRDLAPDRLNEFLMNGSERVEKFAVGSQASHASNIRSLVSGCRRLRLVPRDTLAGYTIPTVPTFEPRWFSDPEVARIFDDLESNRTSVRLRLLACANLALDNGARPEEIVGIRFREVYCAPGEVRLMGKGNRERIVPIGASTVSYLKDYMRIRPAPESPDESIFLDVRDPRKGIDATRLSGDFADVLRATGLRTARGPEGEPACNFYSLRKTFARRSAEAGMDVGELASIMGHSPNSIPMLLKHYYTPTRKHKQLAHAAARPADGLHEWRQRVRPTDRPVPVTLYEKATGGRGSRMSEGSRRISAPSSFRRWSGE
jgi:integrase